MPVRGTQRTSLPFEAVGAELVHGAWGQARGQGGQKSPDSKHARVHEVALAACRQRDPVAPGVVQVHGNVVEKQVQARQVVGVRKEAVGRERVQTLFLVAAVDKPFTPRSLQERSHFLQGRGRSVWVLQLDQLYGLEPLIRISPFKRLMHFLAKSSL